MTQRTHDLAAVAFVSYRFLSQPISINWETLLGIGLATILGSALPDIDNISSRAWKHKIIPWENRATHDFLEGHRQLSHSILGMILFYFVLSVLLNLISLSNISTGIILTAFIWAYLSHLITDSLTEQGVPWLYPIPLKMGFPPYAPLRIKTGKWFEKLVILPSLLILTIYIFYIFRSNLNIFFG